MNRIDALFKRLAQSGGKALMPYITAGFPDLATTAALIEQLGESGADMLELGIPFSDPIADGPVIQDSFTRALSKGLKSEQIFEMIAEVRKRVEIPIAAMVSFSIVKKLGAAKYVERCVEVGIDGLIIPDLCLEETATMRGLIGEAGLSGIMLVAPSTPIDRQDEIARLSSGFIYYMSVAGITGERAALPAELVGQVVRLKEASGGKPVCVGFGISRPEQAAMVGKVADGVIVGSAVIRRISESQGKGTKAIVASVGEYVSSLAAALRQTSG